MLGGCHALATVAEGAAGMMFDDDQGFIDGFLSVSTSPELGVVVATLVAISLLVGAAILLVVVIPEVFERAMQRKK